MEALIRDCVECLASTDAIRRDPYWPKWDGPWWRMTLLWEMGLAHRIPAATVREMTAALDRHCLHFFPIRDSEVPPGVDPVRQVACHCQLGTMVQVLHACGVDVDRELPWIRPWFLKYQLPDGGLNCDETAYAKPEPHSSVVSTLPPLEAVLLCTDRPFTPEEQRFLDRGAEYLLRRRLFRSARTGAVIDAAWLRPVFPRFYFYDVLRGLRFLAACSERLRRPLPREPLAEAVETLRTAEAATPPLDVMTRAEIDGRWDRVPARRFPLLDAVCGDRRFLEASWRAASDV